jgi:hypothetical protein
MRKLRNRARSIDHRIFDTVTYQSFSPCDSLVKVSPLKWRRLKCLPGRIYLPWWVGLLHHWNPETPSLRHLELNSIIWTHLDFNTFNLHTWISQLQHLVGLSSFTQHNFEQFLPPTSGVLTAITSTPLTCEPAKFSMTRGRVLLLT